MAPLEEYVIELAAEFLAQSRLEGGVTSHPPAEFIPTTETDGYQIQAKVHQILQRAGYGKLIGHKIGCTTEVMQKFLNIDYPCAGEVFSTMVFKESIDLALSRFHRVGVECEIAARLQKNMTGEYGPYTRESVRDSVGTLMGAIELVDDRYENYSKLNAPILIADDFFNSGVILGTERSDWHDLNLKKVVGTLVINTKEHSRGISADILGHPLEALAWLANHRAGIGKPLRENEFVMLGSVTQTVFFDEPASIEVNLEGLSTAAVNFI